MSPSQEIILKNNNNGQNTIFHYYNLTFFFCIFAACKSDENDIDLSIPTNGGEDVVLSKTAFTVGYSGKYKQPLWVAYALTRTHVIETEHTPKIPHSFSIDYTINIPQAEYSDYTNSGYVRGHMARHMDFKWDPTAVAESDLMTNICPQTEELNGGLWLRIENTARKMAKEYDTLYIVCGPLFTPSDTVVIGQCNLPVANHFFKAFLFKKNATYHSVAFLCPNDFIRRKNINDFALTIDSLEEITGIDFFSQLDDRTESVAESNIVEWIKFINNKRR